MFTEIIIKLSDNYIIAFCQTMEITSRKKQKLLYQISVTNETIAEQNYNIKLRQRQQPAHKGKMQGTRLRMDQSIEEILYLPSCNLINGRYVTLTPRVSTPNKGFLTWGVLVFSS